MDISAGMGIIVDIIVVLILIFSFLGGLKEGAPKECQTLLAFLIALPLTGLLFGCISGWLSFVSFENWRGLLSFLLAIGIIIIILHLILWFPRNLVTRIWSGGFLWGLLGGVFGLCNAMLGLVLMYTILDIYPVFTWLNDILNSSTVLGWLSAAFGGLIRALLSTMPL